MKEEKKNLINKEVSKAYRKYAKWLRASKYMRTIGAYLDVAIFVIGFFILMPIIFLVMLAEKLVDKNYASSWNKFIEESKKAEEEENV